MPDEAPKFDTKEEFLAWAKKNWPPDSQFCAEHWAPFALREVMGGALFSIVYLTDIVFFDVELAKRSGGDPNTGMKLAAPFCCHYGDEVYKRVMAEVQAPGEWYMDCLRVPRPGGPNRRCHGVLHDECRDARLKPENDRIWGESNWIRCSICPHDANGAEVYHHKDHHA